MILGLKRYGLPIVITVCIYTLLYFLFQSEAGYFNAGLAIALLYAFLIRFADDIVDYEKDLKNDKILLKRKPLIILGCVTAAAILVLAIVFKLYLMLLPLINIALIFLVKNPIGEFLKPLFTPAVVVTLSLSIFKVNYLLWPVVAMLILVDAILVFGRRK